MSVLIETSLGDLEVDLLVDKAPQITRNFLKLCKVKHYNNALLEEVQKHYLTAIRSVKGGTTIEEELNGRNGSQRWIRDEIDISNKHNKMGLLSTSNIGVDRNDSEFFITLSDQPLKHFDEQHTVFGIIQVGREVLEKLNSEVIVDDKNKPYFNLRILHTIILEDPFDDPVGLDEPSSPKRIEISTNDRLEYYERERILAENEQNEEEALEKAKAQIAKVREIKLQILGDIPDADMKPPDNVLFVCQLNAITQERDLEIIFSRFGVITRCEVVRDWKTGDSLQYAFIEFETEKSAQEAYFKMKGALIDERRIQVNFSQSLQKFKPFNKNKRNSSKPATGLDQLEFSKFYRGWENKQTEDGHKMIFDESKEAHKKSERSNNVDKKQEKQEKQEKNQEQPIDKVDEKKHRSRSPKRDYKPRRSPSPRRQRKSRSRSPRRQSPSRKHHQQIRKDKEPRRSRSASRSPSQRKERSSRGSHHHHSSNNNNHHHDRSKRSRSAGRRDKQSSR